MKMAGFILVLVFVALLPNSHHGNENPIIPGTCTLQPCPACNGVGSKTIEVFPKHILCKGTAKKKCSACDGDGIRGYWYGEAIACTVCEKKGQITCCKDGKDRTKEKVKKKVKCDHCGGDGVL